MTTLAEPTTEPTPPELRTLIVALRAQALTTRPDGPGRIRLAEIYDRAVEDLTAGLPDVECAVCLAAAPVLHLEQDLPAAAVADARGLLLAWLAGVEQQLQLGTAVDTALSAARTDRCARAGLVTPGAGLGAAHRSNRSSP